MNNLGSLTGRIARRFVKEKNTTLILEVDDSYEKGGEAVTRVYNIPVVFFAPYAGTLTSFGDGDFVTANYKVTTFRPQDQKYSVISLNGVSVTSATDQATEADSEPW